MPGHSATNGTLVGRGIAVRGFARKSGQLDRVQLRTRGVVVLTVFLSPPAMSQSSEISEKSTDRYRVAETEQIADRPYSCLKSRA